MSYYQTELKVLFLRTRNNNNYLFMELPNKVYDDMSMHSMQGKALIAKGCSSFSDYRCGLNKQLEAAARILIQSRK
jgi:hypothetical protein